MRRDYFKLCPFLRLAGIAPVVVLMAPLTVFAQSAPAQTSAQTAAPTSGAASQVTTTVTVTAWKEPSELQKLPASVTAVTQDTIDGAGITSVSDAGMFAPNTFFSEFTARKLSNAYFRGIGASPANPGVTTFIDGVPQLNANSSSLELIDIAQMEFVRGPQSSLFGRNTAGGLVNIASVRPSFTKWSGNVTAPIGSNGEYDARGSFSGPLNKTMALGFALGYDRRDGFTTNDITGHVLDNRSATFGKGQLLWTPNREWETRVIVGVERARDGDYALNDLGALRQNPFHASRDFEGRTDRTVASTTVFARRQGTRVNFASTTGVVHWRTQDVTDLDYTPLPLATRDNSERDTQVSQEFRFSSAAGAPLQLAAHMKMTWQAGIFLFSQHYKQDAINNLAPFVLSPQIGFPVAQHSPQSELDDFGASFYGMTTVAYREHLEVTFGARADSESRKAILDSFFDPAIAAPTSSKPKRIFTDVSPQLAIAYHLKGDRLGYLSLGRGFKAGGFNPAAPSGKDGFGEEHAVNVEAGIKTPLAGGKVQASAAVFFINWTNLQLNLPNVQVPGQFFIDNVGGAHSTGVEFEATAKPRPNLNVFGSFGYTSATFTDSGAASGVTLSGKKLPNAPDFTAALGLELTHHLSGELTMFGRADVTAHGAFQYDQTNTAGQGAYSLVNIRAGVRGRRIFGELWVRNALDTKYIPLAFAYGNFAPSGFIGESGHPRTFGIRAGVTF